jgi:predicted transposase YbfD/YdcC
VSAVTSALIASALDRLAELSGGDRDRLSGQFPALRGYLAWVPDPRQRRGVRHSLSSLLLVAVAAVLAGAQSLAAIGEWVADAPPAVLEVLGVRWDPLTRRFTPPEESTIRRVMERLDAAALEKAVGSWLAARLRVEGGIDLAERHLRRSREGIRGGPRTGLACAASRSGLRPPAVDGKALRGTRHHTADGQALHLLAVLDLQAQVVLGQLCVGGKTSEITQFAPLLEELDLVGCVVTADALHTQREHAEFLVGVKGAHYILVVKKNQPALYAQLKNLPWRQIPTGHRIRDRGHGRVESRSLQVAAVSSRAGQGLLFPHAAQALRITRRVRPVGGGKWRTVTVYAITSLAAHQAQPAELAAWVRGHWRIEALHHIRDVTYAEDHSRIRTGSGPQVMACVRNLTIGILKLGGHPNIAAARRHHARDATRTVTTLGLTT